MRRLTTGMHSGKCVVRRFRPCANVIECTYTNLDNIASYKHASLNDGDTFCVVRRFRPCGNVIGCTYTNPDSID